MYFVWKGTVFLGWFGRIGADRLFISDRDIKIEPNLREICKNIRRSMYKNIESDTRR